MPSDWVRYWRAATAQVEAMHAHFTTHVYHLHSHESYSFGVTEAGAQAFRCRRSRHVSGPGMIMAFNPDDPHDGHAAADGGFTYRMVHIWPEYFAGLLADMTGRPGTPAALPLFRTPVTGAPEAVMSLRRLHAALTGPATDLERYERLTDTTRHLLRLASPRLSGSRAFPERAAAGPGTRSGTRRIAARVRDLIHDGETAGRRTGLAITDLAMAAGCSRYAACRAFCSVYGMAPSDYQRQLRVRTARRLLAAGIPPALAAAEAGFADQAHLTRWFRRYYGITPGAYRAALALSARAVRPAAAGASAHPRGPGKRACRTPPGPGPGHTAPGHRGGGSRAPALAWHAVPATRTGRAIRSQGRPPRGSRLRRRHLSGGLAGHGGRGQRLAQPIRRRACITA